MADYDSESSGAEDVATNVIVGYASKDPTGEPFSQLGGHPTWLDDKTVPSGTLAKCKVCNGLMSLLLQIRGDLEQFPTHERRLYIWACRKKSCRRREGSVRGFRAIRETAAQSKSTSAGAGKEENTTTAQPTTNLGDTLFGVKSSSTTSQANPFSSTSNPPSANPFQQTSALAAKPPQTPDPISTLPETFAQKARISTPSAPVPTPPESWPEQSAFPTPYPAYNIDPDKEYIETEASTPNPRNAALDSGESSSSSSTAEDKAAFESSMDKTFQKFADRLAQNPEQVLRYEFGGLPLLYSKTDAVGKMLSPGQEGSSHVKVKMTGGGARMPRCASCGAERVFELQLTPHAIAELEADEISVEGMDWGTVILGVCGEDCQERGKMVGEVGYVEEWVGVQWEELASNKRPV